MSTQPTTRPSRIKLELTLRGDDTYAIVVSRGDLRHHMPTAQLERRVGAKDSHLSCHIEHPTHWHALATQDTGLLFDALDHLACALLETSGVAHRHGALRYAHKVTQDVLAEMAHQAASLGDDLTRAQMLGVVADHVLATMRINHRGGDVRRSLIEAAACCLLMAQREDGEGGGTPAKTMEEGTT